MKVSAINGLLSTPAKIQEKKAHSTSPVNSNKQINELSNIYYQPISFGRTKAEHKSWGAQINPETKDVTFKLLTYPDSKKVTVTVIKPNNEEKIYELKNKGKGIFETEKSIPQCEVSHGDKYYYTIEKGNGDIDRVKDPYSFRQEKLLDESTLYDHSLYKWNDDKWFKKDTNRISRQANSTNGLNNVDNARIYELNIASLTKKGNFESAKAAIKALPMMGFNAIEIMPVENTYSFNWGYDGVDKMAPSEHLGGPDGLKSLIDYAHNQGLNVIMDMVPNHLGPDGASLRRTGPFIKGNNCFGEAFNFEGENSKYVRDYIVNAALNWIENYHCDGLRLDMTKFMESDTTMKQIAAEVNYHYPDTFLIAEDSRSSVSTDVEGNNYWTNWDEPHDKRVVKPLQPYESGLGANENIHERAIENIENGNSTLGRLGYDSEWDFNYYHQLKNVLYGTVDLDSFEKACYCSQDRVKYIMSHDEIGNFEGSRLVPKLLVPMLHLNENIILNKEDRLRAKALSKQKGCSEEDATNTVRLQKAQFVAEKLAIMLQTGQLEKFETEGITSRKWISAVEAGFRNEILKPLGIRETSGITAEKLSTMYQKSVNKMKMALARTYSIPGAKMVFQGDERADLTPFRFFRQFDSVKNEDNLYNEKGYKTGISALQASTLGNISYSNKARNNMNKFRALTRDLNTINEMNPALTKGALISENTVKHQYSQVFATHAKDFASENEIFTVTNFADMDYPSKGAADYYIKFPKGIWVEILNTDDKKYGGTGLYNCTHPVESNGSENEPIKLASLSTKMFKKIG